MTTEQLWQWIRDAINRYESFPCETKTRCLMETKPKDNPPAVGDFIIAAYVIEHMNSPLVETYLQFYKPVDLTKAQRVIV